MTLAALPLMRESKSAQFLRFWNVKTPQKHQLQLKCGRPGFTAPWWPLPEAPLASIRGQKKHLSVTFLSSCCSHLHVGSVQDWLFLLAECFIVGALMAEKGDRS